MKDLIEIKTDWNSIFQITKQEVYGGVDIKINPGWTLTEMVEWVKTAKEREEADAKTRSENSFVKGLYDQYKTALELVRKEKGL